MLRGNGLQGFCFDYSLKNRCFDLTVMVNSRAKKMKPVLKPFDIKKVYELLEKEVVGYDVPIVDLIAVQTRDPFKVLVATILSARTKDETTAKAAARLFKKVSDP